MTENFKWVMGIESSCDETAVAILKDGTTLDHYFVKLSRE
jgi:tRNA A37 threonylcarbamoyltransferase TsaD